MADKKIHLSYEDYLNIALDIPGRPKCITNYVIYNWIDGGYYNLNTYSYYIYLPNEFVVEGTYQVKLIKLIRYQTGANLQSAKAYIDNAKNNGLNLYMPESADLATKRKFNSYQEARDFIDTMQIANGEDAPEAIKAAWVIETVAES